MPGKNCISSILRTGGLCYATLRYVTLRYVMLYFVTLRCVTLFSFSLFNHKPFVTLFSLRLLACFCFVHHRVAGPKVEELINTWKNYTVECHQRVVQCKVDVSESLTLGVDT